jgi:DNA-binding HxlR family transcriptional regulator
MPILRRSTGVTNATPSDRLKRLEDSELIERRRYQTNPERHEYVLTAKGRDTILVIQALLQWATSGRFPETRGLRSNLWIEKPDTW